MSLSLYEASIPVMTRGLSQLAAILEKGETYAKESGLDPAAVLDARLSQDMYPLTRQVQAACDAAKFCGARLSGVAAPREPDTEQTFAELQERIARTLAFLGGIEAAQVDGREDAEVVLKTPSQEITFLARNYLLQFSIPNFFFHMTTAYGLLRMQGVPVGKLDFLGPR